MFTATKPGESFNAELVKLDVKASLKDGGKTDGETEEKEYNLIVKFLSIDPLNSEMNQIIGYHIREFMMYSEVISQLNKFQDEKTGNKYPLNIPQFIYGKCTNSEYVLVMENMKTSNYEIISKEKGLNYDEAKIAVECVARLHAVSYAYDKTHGFLDKYPCFMFSSKISKLFKSVVYASVENCIKYLNSTKQKDNLQIVEKLKAGKRVLPAKFSAMWDDQTRHKILCLTHGDFWISNLMFRYSKITEDGTRKIESLNLIDWQITQWNNPIMDLHYLINTSTTLNVRNEHSEDILKCYHKAFTTILSDLNCQIPDFDYQQFKMEFDRTSLVGFLMGLCLIQGTLSKAGEHLNEAQSTCLNNPLCRPIKFVCDKIKTVGAKLIVPVAFDPSCECLLRKCVQNKLKPIGTELASGRNEILNQRLQDLIDEAKDRGIFDVMTL